MGGRNVSLKFLPWKTVYNLEASRAPGPSGPRFRSTVGFSGSTPVFYNPEEISGLGRVLQETGRALKLVALI